MRLHQSATKRVTWVFALHVQVLASAHAVVLASGTLAPIASLEQQLFPHVPLERMRRFTCGHVVKQLFLHRSCMHPTVYTLPACLSLDAFWLTGWNPHRAPA